MKEIQIHRLKFDKVDDIVFVKNEDCPVDKECFCYAVVKNTGIVVDWCKSYVVKMNIKFCKME